MTKYRVECDIVSGTLSAEVEANNSADAKEVFNELGADEMIEEADKRLENYKVECIEAKTETEKMTKIEATEELFKKLYGEMIDSKYCEVLSDKEVSHIVLDVLNHFKIVYAL